MYIYMYEYPEEKLLLSNIILFIMNALKYNNDNI